MRDDSEYVIVQGVPRECVPRKCTVQKIIKKDIVCLFII